MRLLTHEDAWVYPIHHSIVWRIHTRNARNCTEYIVPRSKEKVSTGRMASAERSFGMIANTQIEKVSKINFGIIRLYSTRTFISFSKNTWYASRYRECIK
mmetsp:Transcript_20111/g.55934  ORF Transcript_20111/g.55934 Transcript_20111/m.55934 type:complete len:100 (+) Transcript_20111:1175-1474(+)